MNLGIEWAGGKPNGENEFRLRANNKGIPIIETTGQALAILDALEDYLDKNKDNFRVLNTMERIIDDQKIVARLIK